MRREIVITDSDEAWSNCWRHPSLPPTIDWGT
jgi:hypothetical protein